MSTLTGWPEPEVTPHFPTTYDCPTGASFLLVAPLVMPCSIQWVLSLNWLLVQLPGREGEGPGEVPVLVVVTEHLAIARVLWLSLHCHFSWGWRAALSLSLDQRRRRRITWVSHWWGRSKPPRQVLWLRQALIHRLSHLLETLPVMSSERDLLVTVMMMMRGVVVVVSSTYLIHCSEDTIL